MGKGRGNASILKVKYFHRLCITTLYCLDFI